MLNFNAIRWMNFLSTGNVFTEIILDRSPTTLIVGMNGAGKSTFLDALFFVLFNRPYRKINKSQLINSIIGKGLLVEIEFTKNGHHYLVRRGMKPNVFEIHMDGELIDQSSNSGDYQGYLESSVLGLNHKSFGQVVVLGSANYVPFMQLSAGDRRQVIEDLLDIVVFSNMNGILKKKVEAHREVFNQKKNAVDVARSKVDMAKKAVETLQKNNEEQIAAHNAKIKSYAADALNASIQVKEIKKKIENLNASVLDRTEHREIIQKGESYVSQRRAVEAGLIKDMKFFADHDNCPTCSQTIQPHVRTQRINNIKKQVDEIKKEIEDTKAKIDKSKARLAEIALVDKEISEYNQQISGLNATISSNRRFIDSLMAEIEKLQKKNDNIEFETVEHLQEDLLVAEKEYDMVADDQKLFQVAGQLLKDGGIKARVIRQYVPVMNQLINKFLAALDFFVEFQLDENFEEKILSRHRDEFSYESFSEGEKMRIDLALMFAWRSISKLRNSVSTNLLIMDEIMDSSLDGAGLDEFMKLIQELTGTTNLFIITHRGDTFTEKFSDVIRFKKVKNFSSCERVS